MTVSFWCMGPVKITRTIDLQNSEQMSDCASNVMQYTPYQDNFKIIQVLSMFTEFPTAIV